jgi:hypothetical protein
MEALLQLPVAHHESIIDAFERSKLRVDALPAAKVSEQQIKQPVCLQRCGCIPCFFFVFCFY